MKAWCGDISDADEEDETLSAVKRKFEDDSDSDSLEKKMRLDGDSESEDEIKPSVTVRKVTKTNPVNGVGAKKTTPIGKILIPDSKGIVRINPKQASELTSGVYIMSKTAGIIKLDSNASKFATSGGQAIVKVEPRIGQTQIKVVKKDAAASSVKLTPKPKITVKPVAKVNKEKAAEMKKSPTTAASTPIVYEKKEFEDDKAEDSDDGLPELEFPKDLPLPEPESPPGDFVLDPETGKIAGQDYPEESMVVAVEKPEEPEKDEEKQEEKKDEEAEGEKKETVEEEKEKTKSPETNLENLVKLAAADILDDEEMKEAEEEVEKKQTKVLQQQQPQKVTPSAQSTPVKQVAKEAQDSPMVLILLVILCISTELLKLINGT